MPMISGSVVPALLTARRTPTRNSGCVSDGVQLFERAYLSGERVDGHGRLDLDRPTARREIMQAVERALPASTAQAAEMPAPASCTQHDKLSIQSCFGLGRQDTLPVPLHEVLPGPDPAQEEAEKMLLAGGGATLKQSDHISCHHRKEVTAPRRLAG